MTKRIYAYTLIGKDSEPWMRRQGSTALPGTGLVKVGETTKPTARARIKQQLGTAYPKLEGVGILIDETATRDDGTEFSDHDVHAALVAAGIKRVSGEWFEATEADVRAAILVVRSGIAFEPTRTQSFGMRPEQQEAVSLTADYFRANAGARAPKFLWNAKMRFGKTFSTYQLAREMGWKRVLVLTFKPAVATAWHDDLLSHADFAGWTYVDKDSTPEERDEAADAPGPVVWFASLQDLGGRVDGAIKTKNEVIHLVDWDAIVLDEYHFGAWRDSARALYDPTDKDEAAMEEPEDRVGADDLVDELQVRAKHYLYLSGTPFRAITNGEFTEDAIFNWTYVDEQREKQEWDLAAGPNPYLELPGMEMYTYDLDKKAEDYASDGEFDGFSLNELFRAMKGDDGTYAFERPDEVGEFLEMLRGKMPDQMKLQVLAQDKPPFPYEAVRFKSTIRHAVWYMHNVAACFAMRDMLEAHPYFSQYEIVVAAGSRAGQGALALPPVEAAIGKVDRRRGLGSITLSCGKLMTGVTVREWGAILMLRSLKSPESYFQAAFRVQSPWAVRDAEGTVDVLKPVCYVFEFDPNRALSLVAEYGSTLAASGETTPSKAIGELMNYLPIYAFAGGAMKALDAVGVLDWASAGIGAAALARQWNSPLLVDVNEHTLSAIFEQPTLLESLENIEDFRNLSTDAQQVITNTKDLKKARREQGGKLTGEQKKVQSETAAQRKEIREKLQKFLARVPVFMYATDYREEALKHVIESLDSALFERVTGLTVDDFRTMSDIGLFNAQHLNHAIYQFKRFEAASLEYALTDDERAWRRAHEQIGLWDNVSDVSSPIMRQVANP